MGLLVPVDEYKEYLVEKFTALYKDALKGKYNKKCKLDVRHNTFGNTFTISVGPSEYSLPDMNLHHLIQIASIFGTLNFHKDVDIDRHQWAYSSYTWGTDEFFTHNFTVEEAQINTGLPWEKAGEN